METHYVSNYAKDYEIENQQMQYWFHSLNTVKNQLNVLKDSTETETKLLESLGKGMQTTVKTYCNDTSAYADEPSHLWTITSVFVTLLDSIGKVYSEDILMLNVHINKYWVSVVEDVNCLTKNITDNTNNLMKEISAMRKNSKNLQAKYLKLKADLEEAHLAKKKIESDPNSSYNVTLKEKIEQRILTHLKEMQEFMPVIESSSSELDSKKELFNSNMKESFELVIGSIFKNNVKIKQTFFHLSKEKQEYLTKLKSYNVDRCRKIREIDILLNDYTERKFAETKNIFYESLESIVIYDDDYGLSLIKASDNLTNYANNLFACMRTRKRILRNFSKMVTEYAKNEESFSTNFSKANKQTHEKILSFSYIAKGSMRSWDIYKNMLDMNLRNHDSFSKFLSNNIGGLITNLTNDYKMDYMNFNQSWSKYVKDITYYKNILIKFQSSREKIIAQVKSIRTSINDQNGNGSSSKFENKLSNLKDEESTIKDSIEEVSKKLNVIVKNSLDYLKKRVKIIRDKEFKRMTSFLDCLENICKNFEKLVDQNLDMNQNQMEVCANVDIYQEIKEIFDKYFTTFKISESYFEKIIQKVLKKTDFNFDMNLLSSYSSFKNPNASQNNLYAQDLKYFNSANSNNDYFKPSQSSKSLVNVFNKSKKAKDENSEALSFIERSENRYPSNFVSNLTFKIPNPESDSDSFSKMPSPRRRAENSQITPRQNEVKEEMEEIYAEPNNDILFDNEENSVPTLTGGEEEKIEFVNNANFEIFENNNTYKNIKENELKEYMDKLTRSTTRKINNVEEVKSPDQLFSLDEDEKVINTFSCAYSNRILLQGKLYVTNKKVVFYSWFNSKTLLGKTKLIVPREDIIKIEKKYNLRIFNNSLLITTKKSELFFTSFVLRDLCYNSIDAILLKDVNNDNDNDNDNGNENENEQGEDEITPEGGNNGSNIKPRDKLSIRPRCNHVGKILKKIDFYNRLDKLHKERLAEFDASGLYKLETSYKKFYYREEPVGNLPLPLLFNYLFNIDVQCDELEKEKTFLGSHYELRNDYDITFEESNIDYPKFFEDMEYVISLFSNIEEDSMNALLDDVNTWPKTPSKYSYKLVHPIKKKMFGPDKIPLKEEYNIFFVSPKLIIVETVNIGTGFPYADHFVSLTQWRFHTNYKYYQNENIFKFSTSVSCMFQISFLKSCIFKGVIESEGYKESEENIRYGTYERMRKVIDNQTEIFNQHFCKLNEENFRKTINKYVSLQEPNNDYAVDMIKNNLLENQDEISESEDDSNVATLKVIVREGFTLEGKQKIIEKYYLYIIAVMVGLFMVNFIVNRIDLSVNMSIDKLFNVIVILLLGGLFYKFSMLNRVQNNS